MLHALLSYLQDSPLAALIDGSRYILMVIQAFHLLGLILLLGLAILLNLRLAGVLLPELPVAQLARSLWRPYLATLAVTLAAGTLMALPRLVVYAANTPFVWKLGLILVAVTLQGCLLARVRAATSPASATVRALAVLTLLLWFGIGIAGRAIGFV